MSRPWPLLAAMSALLLAPLGVHTSAVAQAAAPAQARVIVKFKVEPATLRRQALSAASPAQRATTLSQRVGMPLAAGAPVSERMQVFSASGIGSAELAQRLSAQADVEYAVPDTRRRRFVPPNDPRYASVGGSGPASGQWYLRAPTSTVRSAIDAEPAWDITMGNNSVVVAVLDTGIRFDHEDLLAVGAGGSLLPGYDMVSADGGGGFFTANDGTGRDADPSDPGDWVSSADLASGNFDPEDCTEEGSSWHGTQTASLIGALTNNSIGMASVGRNVRVLPVRVLGKCGGYDSDIMAGMRWAAGLAVAGLPANPNPAQVINMSLGGEGACSAGYVDVINEVATQGTVVVASAGNSAGHAVSSPANCAGVIAVTGLRHLGTKVGFADVGPQVALAAPGGNCVNLTGACLYPILTATNAGSTTPVVGSSSYSTGTNPSVGTSFSAPLVAGTVGLMLSARPTMTVADVRAALQASARPFPTSGSDTGVRSCAAPSGAEQLECYCTTTTCGAGMLDAGKAVAAASTGVQARITLSDDTPSPRQAITLSAAGSFALSPRTLTAYQWTLVDGGGVVPALVPNGATATLTPTAVGSVTVSLAVTDSSGAQSTVTRTFEVTAAPAPLIVGDSGGGGGGGLGLVWLLGLALGVITLQAQRNRRVRADSTLH